MKNQLILLFFCALSIQYGHALWCYHCVSTQPGCGDDFNWLWHWTRTCPEDDDVCVKIVERKGVEEIITRECLSALTHRTDIPADKYEGCRPAAKDVRLGHYVNTSVKENDIHREYYDSTTWCFCFLDHRCNSAYTNVPSITITVLTIIGLIIGFN